MFIGCVAYMSSSPLGDSEQSLFFVFGFLAAGTVFTSTVFANLSDKSRSIAALMLPASRLEKYLVGWLYSFVIFQVLFIGCFYLVVSVVLSLDGQPGKLLNIITYNHVGVSVLLLYAILHGVAIWGAIAFEKLSFIKTAFGFFILALLLIVLNNIVLEWMFSRDLATSIPFGQVSYQEKNHFYFIGLSENRKNLLGIYPVVIAIILWLAAYARLKEKQI